jgi:hypothetical protein
LAHVPLGTRRTVLREGGKGCIEFANRQCYAGNAARRDCANSTACHDREKSKSPCDPALLAARKMLARTIAANNGATSRQLTAICGWDTLKEAERYTRKADQERLAKGAMHMLEVRVHAANGDGFDR